MQKFIEQLYLSKLSHVQVEKMLSISHLKKIKKNELLLRSKTICDKSFFLVEGAFVCRYIDEDNAIRKIINFFLEDFQNTFICNDSFFTGKKTNYEIVALVDSKFIEIKKSDLDSLYLNDRELFQFAYNLIYETLAVENNLKNKVISESSENLYKYLIANCPQVIKVVPSKYIAEFMGITPEWLSKLKKVK
jgi:hypothetical protein